MPNEFVDLLTLGGLSAMVVFTMALLKRIRPGTEGSLAWKFASWLGGNQFVASLIVAAVFGVLAWVVVVFLPDYQGQVQELWEMLLLIWGASQVMYNAQKGVSRTVKKT